MDWNEKEIMAMSEIIQKKTNVKEKSQQDWLDVTQWPNGLSSMREQCVRPLVPKYKEVVEIGSVGVGWGSLQSKLSWKPEEEFPEESTQQSHHCQQIKSSKSWDVNVTLSMVIAWDYLSQNLVAQGSLRGTGRLWVRHLAFQGLSYHVYQQNTESQKIVPPSTLTKQNTTKTHYKKYYSA